MKTIAPAALAALSDGSAIVAGAVEIATADPVRVWTGWGQITFDGRTFEPIGDRGLVQVAGGALGGSAQGVSLNLSGIEPEVMQLLDASDAQNAPATLWRLIFSGDGETLLDAHVWSRGRLDQLIREEDIGGTAALKAQVETPAKGLGRRGGRLRSDADQRLVKANDGFFRNISFAGQKTLYWGGRIPANAGTALGGSTAGGSGGGNEPNWRDRVARS